MSNILGAKKLGRPRKDSEAVNVRMERELLDGVDQFITEERPGISRPEAVRLLAREALEKMGLVPPR